MDVRVKWLFSMFLNLILAVQFIESNRRPPMRPPPWRNPNQPHGRGGMPIPIHGDNFANRRIYNGNLPPPGPPNKFPGPPPPMRNKLPPPPGYFNKQRRPPPPPHYGGFNQHMRPGPLNNGPPPPPPPQGFNNMNKQQLPSYGTPQNFHQNQNGYGELPSQVYPTPPPTSPALSPPSTTHQQFQQPQNQQHQHQQFQQSNNQPSHHQQNQHQQQPSQGPPSYQPQDRQPQPSQPPSQNFQNAQPTSSNQGQGQWSQPFPYPNTTQIIGTIQPSQQTAQSSQHMTMVKPDPPKPSSTSQPQQIYQFHLPAGNNQQPNSIIQIHLSSTTESPKEGSGGKDYFTGSTFKPQKYDSVNGYPDTEYLPYEKPKTTPSPALNFKEMNADKVGPYERPIIYKTGKEEEDSRGPYKTHYSKSGQPIDFTTESPYNPPGSYHKPIQNKPDFEPGQDVQTSQQRQDTPVSQSQFSKSDYEHALTPPSKHDYGLLPPVPKHDYGLSPLAKHDYEHYKNYKEYTNKYSQLDPLYHPDGEPKGSNEDDPDPELTLPERYDNSFSTNYKHEEHDAYPDHHYNYNSKDRKRPQGESKPHAPPEEILSALGLSTNPLDHVDIVKTANDKYKKEPLYSLPDRQIDDDEDEDQRGDSKEMGYPGTSYNMPEKSTSASRLHPLKRPPPPEMLHPRIKGLSPPSLSSHVPDHREDDIITADRSSEYFPPKISHREDTPNYGRYPEPPRTRPRRPQATRYPGPPDVSYGEHEYDQSTPPPPGYRGPSPAPPHYHGPTEQSGYGHPIYVTEPDPIIEIIVQDSNVTLPPPPRPKPTTPAPVTPEPVHVFYVRYSNNNNNTINGVASDNQNLRLEPPVPALAVKGPDGQFRPPPNYQQQQQHFNSVFQQHQQPQAQASQPHPNYVPVNPGGTHYNGQGSHFTNPSVSNSGNPHFPNPGAGGIQESQFQPTTTMRAIIRLDKNEFESNQLKVAFEQTNPFFHLQHQQHQPEAEASLQQYTHANPPQNQQHTQANIQQNPSQFQGSNQFVQHRHHPAQQSQQQFVNQNSPAPQRHQFVSPNSPAQQQQHFITQHSPASQQQQPVHQNSQFHYPQQQQQFHQQESQHVPRFSQQVTQFQGHQGHEAQQTFQQHDIQPQASNQNHQTTQFQLPQSQGPSSQFRQGNHEHIVASHQIAQFAQPATNNHFQPQQPNEVQQPQASNHNQHITQFQLPQSQGHQAQQSHQGNVPSSQGPRIQVSGIQENQNQGDSQGFSQIEPQGSPSEVDFNMEPIWTNWNQQDPQQQPQQYPQQQQQQPQQYQQQQPQQYQQQQPQQHPQQYQQQQQPQQQQQQDQNPAPSANINQQVQIVVPPQAPPQPQTSYNPTLNYGGGEPLGLSGLHTIGTENSMRFENPIGLRPPPGPVYPKLGSFQKRIGLDDLATLLGEESNQHQQQIQADTQHQQQQQPNEVPLISATYHDPDQHSTQKQEQPAVQEQHPQQYSVSQQEKMSKLPDDVPEELKKQLLESGILGNAEVQVINYDQNLFKDLTNLPSEAIESFHQSDDISKLLASASRSVRSILVVNEKRRSLRPKRKEASNKLLLFIEDKKTLIYDVKKRSVVTVENKFVQNAIDYTHHKIN